MVRPKISKRMWVSTKFDVKEGREPDEEVLEIYHMEDMLEEIPDWAMEIVEQIRAMSDCGHYTFPRQIDLICEGIGKRSPEMSFRGCYQVDSERKRRMEGYLSCLELWLKEEDVDLAISQKADCRELLKNIYSSLGERNHLKELLVKRSLMRQRWWLKVIPDETWKDRRHRKVAYSWDNQPAGVDLFWDEYKDVEVKTLEEEIRRVLPDADVFLKNIIHSWLCHYKAFRYLEIAISSIGHVEWGSGIQRQGTDRPKICEVLGAYIHSLDCWLRNRDVNEAISEREKFEEAIRKTFDALGTPDDVKIWLVSALKKKIKCFKETKGRT